MQISIETTAGLERRLTISVPSEAFEQKISERLGEAASRVRLPGFRPGRVPMREVRRRFGQAVRVEVAGELMQSSFALAIRQEDLNPAGQPSLEVVRMEPGGDFEFTATFEVFPLVELVNLGRAALKRPVAEIAEADIDAMIERLREQRKTWGSVARAAMEGDRVTVDFVGRLDGEVFDGGRADGSQFIIGGGQMIEDFDKGVQGLAPGENRTFEATFPADYRAEQLAGRTVTFDVTVNAVEAAVLPELDEEFFKAFGVETGGLDAFRSDVRAHMQREMDEAVRNQLKSQVMDQLHSLHQVQLPRALLEREMGTLREQMLQQFRSYGGKGGQPELPLELFKTQAERRVTVGLVVNEIINAAGIKADPAQVRARIEALAEAYAEPQEVMNWYYSNPEQLQSIEMAVLEDQVVEHVVKVATVEEVRAGYEDVISGRAIAPAQDAEAAAAQSA
jgi:trigger factor